MPTLHALANPARFLQLARPLTPVLFWAGRGADRGRLLGRADADAARLSAGRDRPHPLHPRARRLARHGRVERDRDRPASCYLVWRHPLAAIAARAIALPGAVFAALCLVTGSIWGRPTWGTWWQWDGRLTSMLLLFFVYLALYGARPRRCRARRRRARAGDLRRRRTVLLPIIRYSVVWWNTLHQGPSIGLTRSTIDASILWPLPFTLAGFTLLFAGDRADADARDARRGQGRGADAADGARMNHWPFVTAAYARDARRRRRRWSCWRAGCAMRAAERDASEGQASAADARRCSRSARWSARRCSRCRRCKDQAAFFYAPVRRRRDRACRSAGRCGWAGWSGRVGQARRRRRDASTSSSTDGSATTPVDVRGIVARPVPRGIGRGRRRAVPARRQLRRDQPARQA